MTVTAESFRQTFRAFANLALSPEDSTTYYIGLALNSFNASASPAGQRLDPLSLDRAVGLFVAHYLALDARDVDEVLTGGVPGNVAGPSTAEAADKVSFSADTKAVTWDNEAFWNQTRYGVELVNLIKMFGAGGIQVGVPLGGDAGLFGFGFLGFFGDC